MSGGRGGGAGFRVLGAQPCKEIRSCGIVESRDRKQREQMDM